MLRTVLKRLQASTLAATVKDCKETPQRKNIRVLKESDAKVRLLRNTCVRVDPHAAPQMLSAPSLLLLYLSD